MKHPLEFVRRRLLAATVLVVAACGMTGHGDGGDGKGPGDGTPKPPPKPVRHFPDVARPLTGTQDPYEVAGSVTLPPLAAEESKGLRRVFKLSPDVICGSEPIGQEGLNELAAMGIKTVVSVDGKAPDADIAARYGLRYVHIPIEYKGFADVELMQLVKTFRELDGPFYVHDFHGEDRAAAAAAIARLTLDGATREQVLAEMRQRSGAAPLYDGLYRDVAGKPLPTQKQSETYQFSFPPRRQMIGIRVVMIDLPRHHDALKQLAEHDWAPDLGLPGVDAATEASKIAEDFAAAEPLAEVKQQSTDFHERLAAAVDQSHRLPELIGKARAGDANALADSKKLFAQLTQTCADCHAKYRNK